MSGRWRSSSMSPSPTTSRRSSERAARELGGLDLVVNNAGAVRVTAPITDSWEQAVDDFRSMVDVNLGGTYLVGRAAIPHLVQRGGDIVNITTDHIHTCGYPIDGRSCRCGCV